VAVTGGGPLRFEEISTRLRDGTAVVLRPIRPDDKARLSEGLARLSDGSRLRRFMTPVTELSEEQLAYLTDIDYYNHFAWVATLRDRPDFGIGVGRYVRLNEDPQVAEAAITVVDDYQGKGLGTLLLGLLAATARMAGIIRFRGYVLEENLPMLALLQELGSDLEYDSPGVVNVEVPLAEPLVPESPTARALEEAAERVRRARRAARR
jgi:RimJ/RimL family protein N-acetyltransferase